MTTNETVIETVIQTVAAVAPVLAADDDADTRELIAAILGGIGVEHRVLTTGEEVLAAVTGGMPRLVVLDVQMPGRSGLDVCRLVKAGAGTDVAVLLVSAESSAEDIAAGYAAGADDYLTKPFRPRELAQRVRQLLGSTVSEAAR